MDKLNFLPQWYLERQNNKHKKVINIITVILFIINIALVEYLIFNTDKNKRLDNQVKQNAASIKNSSKLNLKNTNKKDKTLENFKFLSDYISLDKDFQQINIENNDITMYYNEAQNFTPIIINIEKENRLSIKHVSYTDENQGQKTLKILLKSR